MDSAKGHPSEIVKTRIVELLRREARPPTVRQIADNLELDPVVVTVDLGELQSTEEVRARLDEHGKTRFEFAPHGDE